jgi:hypothetical protein
MMPDPVALKPTVVWPAWWKAYGTGPSLGSVARVKDLGVGDSRRQAWPEELVAWLVLVVPEQIRKPGLVRKR